MNCRDFSIRSQEHELMDSKTISFVEFHNCLKELEIINIFTIAYRPTLSWLKQILRLGKSKNLTLLDIGSGGGDTLGCIAKWSQKNALNIKLSGIDINPWSKQSAEISLPNSDINFITSDIFDLDEQYQVDLIISSLFTHHLSDQNLIEFIKWMEKKARIGWFVNDLHRHWLPYYFIKYVVKVFSRNRLIQNDAPVSVARAFTKKDWQILLEKANVPHDKYLITWHFPFRYCVRRHK